MQTITGNYYDGITATAVPVAMHVDANGLVQFHCETALSPLPLQDIHAESRISGLPAVLKLPNGGRIETTDFDALDACLRAAGVTHNLLHRLEQHRRIAIVAALLVLGVAAALYFRGLPLAGRIVAPLVPESVVHALGEGVLEQLDQTIFLPTQLSSARQTELQTMFARLNDDPELRTNLKFRDGGWIDANAFALPDGTIVLTDQLAHIAENDEQIAGVLLHEIGHLDGRHAIRQLVQRSGIGVITLMIFGDVSGIGSLLVAMPAIILETAFSRDMEREADDFAAERLDQLDIRLEAFSGFFSRMERYVEHCRITLKDKDGEDKQAAPEGSMVGVIIGGQHLPPVPRIDVDAVRECLADSSAGDAFVDEGSSASGWINYLSTHPATQERIDRLHDR